LPAGQPFRLAAAPRHARVNLRRRGSDTRISHSIQCGARLQVSRAMDNRASSSAQCGTRLQVFTPYGKSSKHFGCVIGTKDEVIGTAEVSHEAATQYSLTELKGTVACPFSCFRFICSIPKRFNRWTTCVSLLIALIPTSIVNYGECDDDDLMSLLLFSIHLLHS
jgi:hypothetical protein